MLHFPSLTKSTPICEENEHIPLHSKASAGLPTDAVEAILGPQPAQSSRAGFPDTKDSR